MRGPVGDRACDDLAITRRLGEMICYRRSRDRVTHTMKWTDADGACSVVQMAMVVHPRG